MNTYLPGIGAILASTAVFLVGNGLVSTLTPLRAHIDGFSSLAVGLIGSGYFAGFVLGCALGPSLLARVGHIRGFAIAAALTAVSVSAMPMLVAPLSWTLWRALAGVCIAILFMAVESWLNDRASNDNRGRILSTYIVVNLGALILGQWLLPLGAPTSFELFNVGAIAYCLCLVPVAMTRLPQPVPLPSLKLRLTPLFMLAPVGAAGCMTVGLANGAFWSLAPVYTQALGFDTGELAIFMTVFIAGGALVQWPIGRISDGMDRRWLIAALSTVAAFCGIALGLLGWLIVRAPSTFFAFVFVLGACMLSLYSLSIAHANDRLPRAEFVQTSAGLLMITAALSVPGPLLAALVMSAAGADSLFLFIALTYAGMAFFAFTRIRMREPPVQEMREGFSPVAHGTPAAVALDPRAPE